jgi:hypothetical protein
MDQNRSERPTRKKKRAMNTAEFAFEVKRLTTNPSFVDFLDYFGRFFIGEKRKPNRSTTHVHADGL